jgi:hypothetical protein
MVISKIKNCREPGNFHKNSIKIEERVFNASRIRVNGFTKQPSSYLSHFATLSVIFSDFGSSNTYLEIFLLAFSSSKFYERSLANLPLHMHQVCS